MKASPIFVCSEWSFGFFLRALS